MGLSTHVLDTMHGCPAAGMAVALYTTKGDDAQLVRQFVLNSDGRSDGPLYDNSTLKVGTYLWCSMWPGISRPRGCPCRSPSSSTR